MRAFLKKLAKRGGVVAIIWMVVRALWDFFSHASTAQWLWDIVKDWPTYLKYAALIVGSKWLPIVLAILCLAAWEWLSRKEKKADVPFSSHELDREDKILLACVDAIAGGKKMFWALLDAKADELPYSDKNALVRIIETLTKRGHENQLAGFPQETWLYILKEARLRPQRPSNEVELYDFICELANLRRASPIQPATQKHGESAQLKERKQKLKNLLAKRERLNAMSESPGFDIPEARRRNERFIAEVRADITRLENEQS